MTTNPTEVKNPGGSREAGDHRNWIGTPVPFGLPSASQARNAEAMRRAPSASVSAVRTGRGDANVYAWPCPSSVESPCHWRYLSICRHSQPPPNRPLMPNMKIPMIATMTPARA